MTTRTLALLFIVLLVPLDARGQTFTAGVELLFYGDNTEFANRFRAGETILGASGQVFLDIALNDTVTVRGGVFGLGRFGAHDALQHAEPALALEIGRGTSRFIFGSLRTVNRRNDVAGPDAETLHRLLPPLHQETLTFTRGQEMGLQYLVGSARVDGDTWLNWQRLNTADHRERLDAGSRVSLALSGPLRFVGQWHVVHEGGQQFQHGAVSDSQAAATGLEWSAAMRATRVTIEAHAVGTRHAPDRRQPQASEGGLGIFTRASVEWDAWRTHAIMWRARDALKMEGDANYLALQRDGGVFRGVRDYAELGLTRHFRPAPDLHLFAAVRLHRIESHYEYSYRIAARVRVKRRL